MSMFARLFFVVMVLSFACSCAADIDTIARQADDAEFKGDRERSIRLLEGLDTDRMEVNYPLAHDYAAAKLPAYDARMLEKSDALLRRIRIEESSNPEARQNLVLTRAAVAVLRGRNAEATAGLATLCPHVALFPCLRRVMAGQQARMDFQSVGYHRSAFEFEFFLNDALFRLTDDTYYYGNRLRALGHLDFAASLAWRRDAIHSGRYDPSVRARFCDMLESTRYARAKAGTLGDGDVLWASDCGPENHE